MIYFKPFQTQEILKLIYLLSEDTGFTFTELYHMRMELLMGLKNVKDQIIEERNKAQEEAQEKASGSSSHMPPGMSSMMSQASSMMSSVKSGSFHMPSMSSLHL